jgi:hypothetical protein
MGRLMFGSSVVRFVSNGRDATQPQCLMWLGRCECGRCNAAAAVMMDGVTTRCERAGRRCGVCAHPNHHRVLCRERERCNATLSSVCNT